MQNPTRKMFMSTMFAVAAAFGLSSTAVVHAADAHIGDVEFSDSSHGDAMESFHPDTAKIFAHIDFSDLAKGSKITATWIAVHTDRAPPNTKIDSTDVTVGTIANSADFSISKPTTAAGWPIGTYRVDISVDGKLAKSEQFDVEK